MKYTNLSHTSIALVAVFCCLLVIGLVVGIMIFTKKPSGNVVPVQPSKKPTAMPTFPVINVTTPAPPDFRCLDNIMALPNNFIGSTNITNVYNNPSIPIGSNGDYIVSYVDTQTLTPKLVKYRFIPNSFLNFEIDPVFNFLDNSLPKGVFTSLAYSVSNNRVVCSYSNYDSSQINAISKTFIVQYDATTGLKDTSFGTFEIPSSVGGQEQSSILILEDNSILCGAAVGDQYGLSPLKLPVLFKILPSAQLDVSFGTNGSVVMPNLNALLCQTASMGQLSIYNNKIYVSYIAFSDNLDPNIYCFLSSFNLSGQVDITFGTNGSILIDTTLTVVPTKLLIDSNGFLFIQYTQLIADLISFKFYSSVAKVSQTGQLDVTFGNTSGKLILPDESVSSSIAFINGINGKFVWVVVKFRQGIVPESQGFEVSENGQSFQTIRISSYNNSSSTLLNVYPFSASRILAIGYILTFEQVGYANLAFFCTTPSTTLPTTLSATPST